MAYNTLIFEQNIHVGVLRINRPQAMNALNHEVVKELNLFLDDIESNSELRCLIITGTGEKAFIAGADIKEINQLSKDQALQFALRGQKTLSRLEALRIPVIAAVNGFTLGGGLEVALSCDFIWASEKSKFGLPEVSLGIMPGYGGTQRLSRWVGLGRAREMTFSGQFYDAIEALGFGLVQRVLPLDRLLPEAIKFAELIASRGPLSLAAAKHSINKGNELELHEGLLMEAQEFSSLFGSVDQIEGTKAFVEKRTPQFKGK